MNVRCAKRLCVMDLADYIREKINSKGISYREVARRSGGAISPSTIVDILKGKNANPTVGVIRALAQGLDEPIDQVLAVAIGIKPSQGWSESRFYELFAAYESLQEERHKRKIDDDIDDLLTIIKAFPKRPKKNNSEEPLRGLR